MLGTITFRDMATYYIEQKTRTSSDEPFSDFNGTYALPRYRNMFSVLSEFGPWTLGGAVRTVGGFNDVDDPYPIPEGTRKVPSHTEVDFQGQWRGFENLTLTLGVRNVFDREPPFSNTNASNNAYTQMGFAGTVQQPRSVLLHDGELQVLLTVDVS